MKNEMRCEMENFPEISVFHFFLTILLFEFSALSEVLRAERAFFVRVQTERRVGVMV